MTQPIPRDAIDRRRVFDAEVIELCVRWYITYRLSYRDLVEIMAERGVQVAHTTILRWVLRYVPEYRSAGADFSNRSERPGEWTKRTSPSEAAGTTSTVPSTSTGRPSASCCALTAASQPHWPSFARRSGRSLQRCRGRSHSMATARAVARYGCCDASTRAGATCAFEPTATSTTSSSRTSCHQASMCFDGRLQVIRHRR